MRFAILTKWETGREEIVTLDCRTENEAVMVLAEEGRRRCQVDQMEVVNTGANFITLHSTKTSFWEDCLDLVLVEFKPAHVTKQENDIPMNLDILA